MNRAAAVLAAVTITLAGGPALGARSDNADDGDIAAFDAERKLKLGVSMHPGTDISILDDFTDSIGGTTSASWTIWANFTDPSFRDFPTAAALAARARGAVPFIWWNPTPGPGGPTDETYFRNTNIIRGDHDDYLRAWAREAKAFGTTILLRFASQGNSKDSPWGWVSTPADDNTRKTYKAMWRHVHRIFRDEGARNVRWVWSIATQTCKGNCLKKSLGYPGDAYVDFLGFTWENWGAAPPGSDDPSRKWIPMIAGLKPIVKRLKSVARRPILATAIASAPAPGDKARWIRKGYRKVRRELGRVKGMMWLNVDLSGPPARDRDWSLVGPSLRAYATIAAEKGFGGAFG